MSRLLERCFVVVALLLFSGGLLLPALGPNDASAATIDPTASSPMAFGAALGVFVLLTLFVLRHWHAFARGALASRWLVALSMWALLSTVWSGDPELTLRRSVALAATTAFGIYFGTCFSRHEQLRLLGLAVAMLAIASLCFGLLLPQHGIHTGFHAGDWRGVFSHKNILGRTMDLAFIVFLAVVVRRAPVLRWAALLLCAGLVALSGSRAAQLMLLTIVAVLLPVAILLRRRMNEIVTGIAVACMLGAVTAYVLMTEWNPFLQLLGRDSTLTGRTQLWTYLLGPAQHRLWLGYGYGAFWTGMGGPSASALIAVHWAVLHAHNGFLELWLNLGVGGLALLGMSLFITLKHATTVLRQSRTRESLWPFLFIVWLLLYNFVDTSLVRQNDLVWVLYAAIATALCLERVTFLQDRADWSESGVEYSHSVGRTLGCA